MVQKNSEILFFPRSNPFSTEGSRYARAEPTKTSGKLSTDSIDTKSNLGDAWELDTNLIPTILPFQNGGQTWRKTLTY